MDTALYNGDFLCTAGGIPVELTGQAALLQQAAIRLKARRGAFPYDPGLGSRLSALEPGTVTLETALACIEEALEGSGLEAVSTVVSEEGVTVEIATAYGNGSIVI